MPEKKQIVKCPFCGSDEVGLYSEDVPVFNDDDETEAVFARMVCGQCAAEGPLVTFEADSRGEIIKQAAIKIWNTRSDENISTESTIKPCPFCGKSPEVLSDPIPDDSNESAEELVREIFCPDCSATGPVNTREDRTVLWNHRLKPTS